CPTVNVDSEKQDLLFLPLGPVWDDLVGDWSCFEQGVGLDDILRSIATLRFYDSPSGGICNWRFLTITVL
uniref:Uncharacterized protein n=1 Tax=Chelonoidis abingdonii TaxID=106734 RepID=A0A8C0FVY1_CHEAB